jgi:hypothetical protein
MIIFNLYFLIPTFLYCLFCLFGRVFERFFFLFQFFSNIRLFFFNFFFFNFFLTCDVLALISERDCSHDFGRPKKRLNCFSN